MESQKHQQAGPHFVPEPADHKMFHQDSGTCYEATGTGIDKCLMPGQAIIPLFNLTTQCRPISLFSINRWYSGCPHTEWEMKVYWLQRFLRLLPPPHCMRRVLQGQHDITFMRPSHGRAPVTALVMATAGKWADGYWPRTQVHTHPPTHLSSITNQTHPETSDWNKSKFRVSKREREPVCHGGNVLHLNHSPVRGHEGCFQFGVTAHKAAMNIRTQGLVRT